MPVQTLEDKLKLLTACILSSKTPLDINFQQVATFVGATTAGAASQRFHKLMRKERADFDKIITGGANSESSGGGTSSTNSTPKKRGSKTSAVAKNEDLDEDTIVVEGSGKKRKVENGVSIKPERLEEGRVIKVEYGVGIDESDDADAAGKGYVGFDSAQAKTS